MAMEWHIIAVIRNSQLQLLLHLREKPKRRQGFVFDFFFSLLRWKYYKESSLLFFYSLVISVILSPLSTQEVIESVVALTSEEEERRGVAATLLAPLIPEEVKEAEEKWRKKVLATEETVEAAQELEGEGTPSLDSPAVRDTDSQSNQRSRNHSAESSDREEEAEEDTMELELALERKKVSCMIRNNVLVYILYE